MKIIFHENQLSFRGTSNAIYNYARFNEEYLGNESIIIYQKSNKNNFRPAIEKFHKRFEVISYSTPTELDDFISRKQADLFYAIKAGMIDDIAPHGCKTAVHAVFKHYEPHGDVYAYVSEWLSREMTNGKAPFVPHMICIEETDEDLRRELKVPKDAIVFGRHGGESTFDIPFVQNLVDEISKKRKDIYFIFLGTNRFTTRSIFSRRKNVIFLPATQDEIYKAKFINTCDAYLHARKQGESFGIAIGEFSIRNKPVITWTDSEEKSHIEILGNRAILYKNSEDLSKIVQTFEPNQSANWDAYSADYSPQKVMDKFKKVFIDQKHQ